MKVGSFNKRNLAASAVVLIASLLLGGTLTLYGCGGGGGDGGTPAPGTGGGDSNLIATWNLITMGDTDVSELNVTLTITATTYTFSDPDCTVVGTWSADGSTIITKVTSSTGTGENCQDPVGSESTISYTVTSTTLTIPNEEEEVDMVFSKEAAGDGMDGDGLNGCTIAITVGAGTTPQYSWDGGGVNSLIVNKSLDPETVSWTVGSLAEDGIASPVTHGTYPDNSYGFAMEEVLTAGVMYRVGVVRTDETCGIKDFTP